MTAPDCPECGGPFMDAPHPNYDHIHQARPGRFPRATRTDGHQVTCGYAVGMSGRLPQVWAFFDHLEPAVAFGRAGRQSGTDIASYGVYEAAHELLYDDDLARDVSILHVDLDADLRDHQSERPILERWLRGTHTARTTSTTAGVSGADSFDRVIIGSPRAAARGRSASNLAPAATCPPFPS